MGPDVAYPLSLIIGYLLGSIPFGLVLTKLAGTPDLGKGDGQYSLNGDPWKSLPGAPTKQLSIGSSG